MLRLEKLVLRHRDGFSLEADLAISKGARVVIIGPSGAGKSSLLASIAGFVQPDSGQIYWDALDLLPLAVGARPISMIFQDNNLFPHLTAAQNVGLGITSRGRLRAEEAELVEETLAQVGLAGLGERKPKALSGGQQSRVALARMVLQNRPLVLLDEPFSALGPALRAEMLDLLSALCDRTGATVLMVSHDPADALRFASHVIWLDQGRAHAPKPAKEIMADPPDAMRAYLGL
ncbi:MAG: ATP-binding cassette domain-containing protein [Paracoccaceae bacterium]